MRPMSILLMSIFIKNPRVVNFLRSSVPSIISFSVFFFPLYESCAETWEIDTYYPSPYGVYNELSTTGNTTLATTSGNVGIGTTNPQAKLDINSTTSGFLPPRLTQAQRDNNIASPGEGMMLYNTDQDTFEYWDGTDWVGFNEDKGIWLGQILLAQSTNLKLDTSTTSWRNVDQGNPWNVQVSSKKKKDGSDFVAIGCTNNECLRIDIRDFGNGFYTLRWNYRGVIDATSKYSTALRVQMRGSIDTDEWITLDRTDNIYDGRCTACALGVGGEYCKDGQEYTYSEVDENGNESPRSVKFNARGWGYNAAGSYVRREYLYFRIQSRTLATDALRWQSMLTGAYLSVSRGSADQDETTLGVRSYTPSFTTYNNCSGGIVGCGGHTEANCAAAGGNVVDDGTGMKFCRFTMGSCPSGWCQYNNWSATSSRSFGPTCNCTNGSCTTGSHAWSNTGIEDCWYDTLGCEPTCSGWTNVFATVNEIGCY